MVQDNALVYSALEQADRGALESRNAIILPLWGSEPSLSPALVLPPPASPALGTQSNDQSSPLLPCPPNSRKEGELNFPFPVLSRLQSVQMLQEITLVNVVICQFLNNQHAYHIWGLLNFFLIYGSFVGQMRITVNGCNLLASLSAPNDAIF